MHANLADLTITASDQTSEATNSPTTGSRPVSSGVTVTVWPGFRPMGSCGSTVALAIDVASLATSRACSALIWLRLPWPIAAMRSAQVRSLGKPSSGAMKRDTALVRPDDSVQWRPRGRRRSAARPSSSATVDRVDGISTAASVRNPLPPIRGEREGAPTVPPERKTAFDDDDIESGKRLRSAGTAVPGVRARVAPVRDLG